MKYAPFLLFLFACGNNKANQLSELQKEYNQTKIEQQKKQAAVDSTLDANAGKGGDIINSPDYLQLKKEAGELRAKMTRLQTSIDSLNAAK